MIYLLTRLLVVVLALLLVAEFVPGIEVEGFYTALIVAIILGLLNITIKPILFVLTLPITLLTFGLFSFVLNGLIFWFVASFVEGFSVDGFVPAFIGALIVTLCSWLINKLT